MTAPTGKLLRPSRPHRLDHHAAAQQDEPERPELEDLYGLHHPQPIQDQQDPEEHEAEPHDEVRAFVRVPFVI